MAALGASNDGWDVDWVLQELLKADDASTLPVFERWASEVNVKPINAQGAAQNFACAHMGCARYRETPPVLKSIATDDQLAWQLYGEIIFWLCRPGLSDSEVDAKCVPILEQLRTKYPFEAVDPLVRFGNEAHTKGSPIQRMYAKYNNTLRQILEFGLANRTHLSTVFTDRGSWTGKEQVEFMIKELAIIGTTDSIRVIEPLIDSPEFSSWAVDAVRTLKNAISTRAAGTASAMSF